MWWNNFVYTAGCNIISVFYMADLNITIFIMYNKIWAVFIVYCKTENTNISLSDVNYSIETRNALAFYYIFAVVQQYKNRNTLYYEHVCLLNNCIETLSLYFILNDILAK